MSLICAWCGAPGQIIGDAKSFPRIKAAKCTKCHHEWEAFAPKDAGYERPKPHIGLGLCTEAREYAQRNLTADESQHFLHGVSWATYQLKKRPEFQKEVPLCGEHNYGLPAGTVSSLNSADCVVCKALALGKA